MGSSRRVLAVLPGFIPSTFMNVIKPFLALEKAGQVDFRVNLEAYLSLSELEWPDLVVFCRNTEPIFAPILETVIRKNIPYIYDLDDNLFEISLDTDLGKYHRAPQRLELLSRYIRQARLVRVYSRPLAERTRILNPMTVQVNAVVDWKNIQQRRISANRPLQIVYATSREEDQLAQIFLPAIEQILERFSGQVEMNFWGYIPNQLIDRPGVHHLKPLKNYDEFMGRFSSMGFDIGLAPLFDDEFHRSKTNNKFREYSACQIAGIYSDVETYSTCVQHAVTGLLVKNSVQDWVEALTRLIVDGELRQNIARQGLDYARQHFSQEALIQLWQSQMEEVLIEIAPSMVQAKEVTEQKASGEPLKPADWYRQRLDRIARGIGDQTLTSIWHKISLTASNLWFLYRINVLKRL